MRRDCRRNGPGDHGFLPAGKAWKGPQRHLRPYAAPFIDQCAYRVSEFCIEAEELAAKQRKAWLKKKAKEDKEKAAKEKAEKAEAEAKEKAEKEAAEAAAAKHSDESAAHTEL